MKAILALVLAIPLLAACSSSTSSGSGNCSNITGTWAVSGACGPDTCVITQSSCSTNFSCSAGTVSYTGSVSGNSVSYSGQTAAGATGTCSGTVNGGTMSGTCNSQGQTCAFSATRQ